MISFYLDPQSGLPPYLQLVQQVRRAMLLGHLREGDQLPTVKTVVTSLAINPNTVSKAYRELESEGLVLARAGVGTFVATTLDQSAGSVNTPLRHSLGTWIEKARELGLDDERIEALFVDGLRSSGVEELS